VGIGWAYEIKNQEQAIFIKSCSKSYFTVTTLQQLSLSLHTDCLSTQPVAKATGALLRHIPSSAPGNRALHRPEQTVSSLLQAFAEIYSRLTILFW